MMTTFNILQSHLLLFALLVGVFGLCMGSLVNVIIHRLPIMLKLTWEQECHAYLKSENNTAAVTRYNLFLPRSHCPECKNTIKAWQNIPLLSYLLLKGQCFYCKKAISIRYPLIELTSAVLSVYLAWHFDISLQTLFALLFTYMLLSLAVIDLEHLLLPDNLTLPFFVVRINIKYL